MNEIQKNEIKRELHRYLKSMDIPKLRFDDVNWLDRNIAINNSDHPNFLIATWLIKKLKKASMSNG